MGSTLCPCFFFYLFDNNCKQKNQTDHIYKKEAIYHVLSICWLLIQQCMILFFYLCSKMTSACIHACMALFYTFHQSCMMRMLIAATTTFATLRTFRDPWIEDRVDGRRHYHVWMIAHRFCGKQKWMHLHRDPKKHGWARRHHNIPRSAEKPPRLAVRSEEL